MDQCLSTNCVDFHRSLVVLNLLQFPSCPLQAEASLLFEGAPQRYQRAALYLTPSDRSKSFANISTTHPHGVRLY